MINLIKRVLNNEDGVSMTEFVVTLPAFIICFVAISQMSVMLRDGTDAARFASQDVWRQALTISEPDAEYQRSSLKVDSYMGPKSARNFASAGIAYGIDVKSFYKESPDPTATFVLEEALAFGLTTGADFGEFYARMGAINSWNYVMDALPFGGVKIVPKGAPSKDIGLTGSALYGTKLGKLLFGSGIGEFSIKGFAYKSVFSALTGARYGAVVGAVEKEGETRLGKYKAARYVTTLVAPTGEQMMDELGPAMFVAIGGIPALPALGNLSSLIGGEPYTEIFGLSRNRKKVGGHRQSLEDPWE